MDGVEVLSFGYGHSRPPQAHITIDLRSHFKDPHVNPALRCLTAADAEVSHAVTGTPGVPSLTCAIAAMVRAFRDGPGRGSVKVAIGCVGGRHRSAVVANEVARILAEEGVPVAVTHRHMDRPVIERL
jgi:RNase adaptor protein for sRNA GlmZ degradation